MAHKKSPGPLQVIWTSLFLGSMAAAWVLQGLHPIAQVMAGTLIASAIWGVANHLSRKEIARLVEVIRGLESDLKRTSLRQVDLNRIETVKAENIALKKENRALAKENAQLISQHDDITKATEILDRAKVKFNEFKGHAKALVEEAREERKLLDLDIQTARDMLVALEHQVEGYGPLVVVPATAVAEELADKYQFDDMGKMLKDFRVRVRAFAKHGGAIEPPARDDRERTIGAFLVDVFDGKFEHVIADRSFKDPGTLSEMIRDAFAYVNRHAPLMGRIRLDKNYLNSRLEEFRLLVAVEEIRRQQREEQARIRELVREEVKVHKEIERERRRAEADSISLKEAIARAEQKALAATESMRGRYEEELSRLSERLAEAEARNQRALSMAQQTRAGHVYVISNIGSFGEDVVKIGLTRRLEPLDRVRELGDASVPFEFDVHAIIYSEDAPTLETLLHRRFAERQINKVNPRKEFFRLTIDEIKGALDGMDVRTEWTIAAAARQYRETLAIESQIQSDPVKKLEWLAHEQAFTATGIEEISQEAILEDATETVDAL